MELDRETLYGVMAEFASAEDLVRAARAARAAGYRRVEGYSPYHVDGLAETLGMKATRLPWLVLAGGIFGAAAGYGLQVWTSTTAYPYQVGGRPLHSWPMFIPVTFELTILCAALAAVLGMLFLNGLPRPYHPVFNAKRFALATRDRFFLCIEAADEKFELDRVREFMEELDAESIEEVAE